MHLLAARTAVIGATFLVASAACAAPRLSAQSLTKLRGEKDEAFAARVLGLKTSDIHVLATTWDGVRTLFVDYVRGADTDRPERPIVALEETAQGAFRKLEVTVGETEGGEPDLAAIGFANADRDRAKELIVILAWRQYHAGACGPIYEVRIFDDPTNPSVDRSLRQLPISKHFGEGCAGKPGGFKFTTISAVKAELSKLGH